MKNVIRIFLFSVFTGSIAPHMSIADTVIELSPESGSWKLLEYLDEAGDMKPVGPEIRVDAQFLQGRVSGTAGCNRYSGSYSIKEGGALVISGEIAVTQMACSPSISRLEQRYLALLPDVFAYRMGGESLVLIAAGKQQLLHFVKVLEAGLEHTTWQAVGINNGRGGVVSNRNTHLTTALLAEGQISGNAGCNSYSASYQVKDDSLIIGPVRTTRKHCGEPAGIMQQEQEYLGALAQTRKYALRPEGLELRSPEGSLLVRFVPVPAGN